MRTIINLFFTLLLISPLAPIIFTFTIGGIKVLEEGGHSVWATLLPFIALVVFVILIKVIYKLVDYLIRTFFG